MRIITNQDDLVVYLEQSQNEVDVSFCRDECTNQITQINLHGGPQCEHFNINLKCEYEHLDNYDVEINYNYSGEFEFKNITFKHVLYLLQVELILK